MQRPSVRHLGVSAIAALVLAGCTQVYTSGGEPQPSPSQPAQAQKSQAEDSGPFKPYDEVLKDTEKKEGFFTVHIKRDNTLFLEITPEQLDSDFGLMMHYSRGIGDFNVHDGLPVLGNTQLLRFERHGDKLYLVHRNPRFTADEGTPMATSLADNVGHSVVAAFDIKAKHSETDNLVIDATEFFVSDYGDDGRWLKFWYGNRPVRFDKSRSYVENVMAFPQNVEIDAFLTYQASEYPQYGGAGVSDYRSIPIGMRYSLFALPDEPMRPRLADDRVGHFLTAFKDFSKDQQETSYVRYVERWRLEKKDPNAEISEPVEPIVYYIDRSVPLEYRPHVKEGIEGWNKAFEAAGFRNAVVAKEAPDDPEWSAEDIRYSTVRWTAAHSMGYAIGPSQTDPRTGELLNADVLISSTFVRSWLYDWQEMAGVEGMVEAFNRAEGMRQLLGPERAARICTAAMGKAHQIGVQYALLLGTGVIDAGEPMPEEYLGDAIRDLVLHEVGHTLGLRHNFKGSSGIPHDRLNDESFTGEHGLTLSVMDYGPVNVAVDPDQQGHYWNKQVGTYDEWAIEYAYTQISGSGYAATSTNGTNGTNGDGWTPESERAALQAIAAESADPYHTYGTDEDNWLGVWAVDPLTNGWDLGNPMRHARDRAAIIARVQPRLESRLIEPGEGYQRLRGATNSLIFERYISLYPITKTVGGLYFHRDHKGQPNARMPFDPVPAAEQRAAVQLIVDQAFDEDAFTFDAERLNKLAPNRFSHWGVGWGGTPVDFPVHSLVGTVQRYLMNQLMSPIRIGRMIDNELRTPGDAYTAAELFNSMTSATWSEVSGTRARPVNSFRRNLQRMYTDHLIEIMLSDEPTVPEDARSLARLHLKRIASNIESAGTGGLDDFTLAHLDETQARIERALKAQASVDMEE
ncbi:MAG: zinc-dependent metalloprotease [Gemmatimonadetes bacterium]|uniref:Zinc-dependent metalloprotease n=1 Tax=Candidatus Kutchimonas denitrificans TaxID=3056748 RepID=A0AAE4Z860_9BACT|nr:zinc-dependent metalloprotease [Gemmatimonadota bacterium]NIR74457.1 zinc-dependent metalloprotease [Candidatus Kutchimonas denitrificans]NIS00853.1 zinc-dependent metalloprotease [Gemmatimonadota bacterium]NIT66476.1 zinc-dependent metalloprotease [Gemmatimonadota bacterium]NIU52107.1 DUF5117 domain-containing protein [Gemmatimonadota bacterium]